MVIVLSSIIFIPTWHTEPQKSTNIAKLWISDSIIRNYSILLIIQNKTINKCIITSTVAYSIGFFISARHIVHVNGILNAVGLNEVFLSMLQVPDIVALVPANFHKSTRMFW